MSFLKQLLKPFVEFEEDPKKQPASVSRPAAPVPPTSATPPTDAPAEHPLITGQPSPPATPDPTPAYTPSGTMARPLPEHVQYFERLIDEANAHNPIFQGADYKEFIDSKLDIDDITDEALKYRTAFNVLKNSGLTKAKILSTAQEYLQLIGRDLNAFQSAHAQQYQKEVGHKEQEIQKKAEELQQLTLRMQALKNEINQLTQDISLTRDQLNTTKQSFLLAGENKQNEIQTELQKIERYF